MKHSKPPYPLDPKRALICMLILASPLAVAETKQNVDGKKAAADKSKAVMADMTVTEKIKPTAKEVYKLPATTESVTSEKIDNTINAM
ncbi:MAG: TonB-dependent receptor, partial [Methylobacter sp.]